LASAIRKRRSAPDGEQAGFNGWFVVIHAKSFAQRVPDGSLSPAVATASLRSVLGAIAGRGALLPRMRKKTAP
jgi:hypothetical protein